MESEKASVEARLLEFSLRQRQDTITEDKIINYLLHYQKDLLVGDPNICRRVVEEFVESVKVKKDTIEIAFKVSVVPNGGGGAYPCVCRNIIKAARDFTYPFISVFVAEAD